MDMPTPTIKKTHTKAIHWACLAAKENQNTITILTIPDEEWATNDAPYKTIFDDTHVTIHFPPDTIIYTEPTIPPKLNKEPRIETLAVRILCIHHKNTTIDIPNLESKLLQATTELRINPPHIITPPPTQPTLKYTNIPNGTNHHTPLNSIPPRLPNYLTSHTYINQNSHDNTVTTRMVHLSHLNNKPMDSGTQHKLDMAFGTHY
jgi:hypothetical protein